LSEHGCFDGTGWAEALDRRREGEEDKGLPTGLNGATNLFARSGVMLKFRGRGLDPSQSKQNTAPEGWISPFGGGGGSERAKLE